MLPVNCSRPPADEETLYEFVDGKWVKMPAMSVYSALTASHFAFTVGRFVDDRDLGEVAAHLLFHLPLVEDRNRRPDFAFVSYQRWAKDRPIPEGDNAWDVVPNLAVEIMSPTDLAEDLLEKIEEYFRAGVELVWVVYPRRRTIHVYDSLTKIRVVTRTDELDGGKVLPDFRLPLTTLFHDDVPQHDS